VLAENRRSLAGGNIAVSFGKSADLGYPSPHRSIEIMNLAENIQKSMALSNLRAKP
jgi:hypothetical protein